MTKLTEIADKINDLMIEYLDEIIQINNNNPDGQETICLTATYFPDKRMTWMKVIRDYITNEE